MLKILISNYRSGANIVEKLKRTEEYLQLEILESTAFDENDKKSGKRQSFRRKGLLFSVGIVDCFIFYFQLLHSGREITFTFSLFQYENKKLHI